MMKRHYAHSLKNKPELEWEPLEDHLHNVAELAGEFAAKFDAYEWAKVVGWWHDLGKYSEAFQNYLRRENGLEAHLEQKTGRVDHSTAGAQHASSTVDVWGRLLAYVIAGHHAGLADSVGGRASLQQRLKRAIEPISGVPNEVLMSSVSLPNPRLTVAPASHDRLAFQLAFFTRMLFSCLVDADFLATEAFMSPERSLNRPAGGNQFAEMKVALDKRLHELRAKSEKGPGNQTVNSCRREALEACRSAANEAPGVFSLTVPTGGGKTLASLAFALNHAIRHGMNRVIYAIPFTSIIEQTASVFRDVFAQLGDEVVLEHHSNVDPDAKNETPQSRLAAENWDAPLVITTNVQLLESLYAARTARCRKLHNIVDSVIILDEAQTLSVELLRPVLAALRELVADYHCSVVLCTATQPALVQSEEFSIGLESVREIIPNPIELNQRMKRVEVESLGRVTDHDLVTRLAELPSSLTIVNTRPHASRLFNRIRDQLDGPEGLYHLSTYLCGEHRSDILSNLHERLARGLPCRVVSTQLIEAGVDIDFPVVFRAMTGLDSLAQAAGRCNREGKLPCGKVYLFDPVDCQPRGYLGSVAATAREIIPNFADILDQAAVYQYFQLHYWKQAGENQWDDRQVMNCFPTPPQNFAFDFRTAAERFRMIEDTTKPVFVPYGRGRALIEQLRRDGPNRKLLRRLQRFSVGVYEQVYVKMVGSDVEELHNGGFAVLINEDLYDEQLGLRVDRLGFHEPDSLIA